jgi:hypothetical protein
MQGPQWGSSSLLTWSFGPNRLREHRERFVRGGCQPVGCCFGRQSSLKHPCLMTPDPTATVPELGPPRNLAREEKGFELRSVSLHGRSAPTSGHAR